MVGQPRIRHTCCITELLDSRLRVRTKRLRLYKTLGQASSTTFRTPINPLKRRTNLDLTPDSGAEPSHCDHTYA